MGAAHFVRQPESEERNITILGAACGTSSRFAGFTEAMLQFLFPSGSLQRQGKAITLTRKIANQFAFFFRETEDKAIQFSSVARSGISL